MQETRQHILEILKDRGQATVDDIVAELQQRRGAITAVTVRHHLNVLHEDDLITAPELRHRATPGRPQHVYMLTDKAKEHFPNNYQPLTNALLEQITLQFSEPQVNVILEGVAGRMAQNAQIPDGLLPQKLDRVVQYLNTHGYNAQWQSHPEGYVLETTNCPYHHITTANPMLCEMDMRLVASLLGVVPRLMARSSRGDDKCAYLIPGA